jgi:ArsR family transcriptional regulator
MKSLPMLKALADPMRLQVLSRLMPGGKEYTVTEVASCCPKHLSVISRHLGVLRKAGLVLAEKRGKEVFYRLDAEAVADLLIELARTLKTQRRSS